MVPVFALLLFAPKAITYHQMSAEITVFKADLQWELLDGSERHLAALDYLVLSVALGRQLPLTSGI